MLPIGTVASNKMQPSILQSKWAGGLCVLTAFALAAWVSNLEKGLAAGMAAAAFVGVIQTKSESTRDARFWTILSIFALIHIAVISLVAFPQVKAGMIYAPFALVDGFIMWGFINWVEKRVPRK